MLHRFCYWLGGIVLALVVLVLLSPMMIYWVGLHGISRLPEPPTEVLSAAQQDWVWRLTKSPGEPVIEKRNPYSYVYRFYTMANTDNVASPQKTSGGDRVVHWVTRDYLHTLEARPSNTWWQLSNASLSIWLTRHWTQEQIFAASFKALHNMREVYDEATSSAQKIPRS